MSGKSFGMWLLSEQFGMLAFDIFTRFTFMIMGVTFCICLVCGSALFAKWAITQLILNW